MPADRRQAFADAGVRLFDVAGGERGVDLARGLQALGAAGLTRVLVEGGAKVAAGLLRDGLVDRIAWFHAPRIVGGDGWPAAQAFGVARLADMPRFVRTGARRGGRHADRIPKGRLMFTGIISAVGRVRSVEPIAAGRDMRLVIEQAWAEPPAIGASIACSGCCLTAVALGPDWFAVDASAETLAHTVLGSWRPARRSTWSARCAWATSWAATSSPATSTAWARCVARTPENGSTRFRIRVPAALARFIAAKGSVAVNGISLTVNEVDGGRVRRQHHPAHARPHRSRRAAAGRRSTSRSTRWPATWRAWPRRRRNAA